MSLVNALLILSLLAISSGCATIIHGTTQDVGITTDPTGADLLLDGKERYQSPIKVTMKRKEDHMVEIIKDGYQKETVYIQSVLSGAVAGNLLAGGIIGMGVDAMSGGGYRLVPENIDIRLRPLTSQSEGSTESIEDKLDQLRKLKEKGKITKAEYTKMRQELLASPGKGKITATRSKIEIGDKIGPDQALIKLSFDKAKELGHNGVPIFVRKKGGNVIIVGGAVFSIGNNQAQWAENDMIINVGEFSIPFGGFTIEKGEYAVVINGSPVKQPGKITSSPALDISQQENYSGTITKYYLQFMNTDNGLRQFIAIELQEYPTKMFMVAREDAKNYGIKNGVEGNKINLTCKRLSQSEEKYIVTNMQIR